MRYTLLEMVKRVLASMDSDDVSSITDTAESVQVGLLIEGCFFDLVTEIGIPPHGDFFQLTESGSSSQPTLMTVPTEVIQYDWIKYNKQDAADTYANWTEIDYMPLDRFLEHVNSWRSETSNVGNQSVTVTSTDGTYTIDFMYRTDKHPDYYTSYDDSTVIFDSYDVSIDTSYLLKAKTQCWGRLVPSFTQADAFVPELNPDQFSLLLNMAKKRAWEELKQMTNQDAAQHARRNMIRQRNTKRKTPWEQPDPLMRTPRYGRI